MQPVQDLTIDATVSRTSTASCSRTRTRRIGAMGAASWSSAMAAMPAIRGRRKRPAAERALGLYRRSTATPPGVSASRRRPSTTRSTMLSASASSRPSSPRRNQYRVILEADPALQNSLDSLGAIYLPSSVASSGQVPLSAIATVSQRDGAAADQPSRPVSGEHHLVQPRARRLARRRGRRGQAGRAADRPAGQHRHHFQGAALGLPGLAQQRALPDPRGDRHRLHRAGRAL